MSRAEPKLTRTRYVIDYASNDQYQMSQKHDSSDLPAEHGPEVVFLQAIQELARITALFGFQEQAKAHFDAGQKAIADWRAAA
jgi:hypothetical protein